MADLLQVENLTMQFGGLCAVDQVSFGVEPNQITAIIGPNGAGKTTLFNCISGFYQPTSGKVSMLGKEITALPSHKIAQRGLVRTFQNIRLFKAMTVVENLMVAQHSRLNSNLLSGMFKTRNYRQKESEAIERVHYWLDQMGLTEFANREAGNLAYGQQRRLEIARCMVLDPKLLLLDEPAAGLNPNETLELNQLILSLRDNNDLTVLLIEHDMKLVMEISDHIVVLDQGMPIAAGDPDEIRNNKRVINAYLGEGDES
ncbi:MAG: high-affinity branched-chain amino acid ABC transporter ATP-binding protein LivG [Gammaproteobacteria bacterium]|nr:high-affinity branched-chain amino acid ABC transporter ATP-binding protein LivG [Gammaproteobacteria bacterium]